MIKINLALKKQAVSAEAGGETKSIRMNFAKFDAEFIKGIFEEFPIRSMLVPVFVYLGVSWFYEDYTKTELEKVAAEVEQAEESKRKVMAELAKTKGYEEIKKSIEADELLLRNKLELLKSILNGRERTPLMLRSIAEVRPKEIWLRTLDISATEVKLNGTSVDFNLIPHFMRLLESSTYFNGVDMKSYKADRDETGIDITNFELVARLKP